MARFVPELFFEFDLILIGTSRPAGTFRPEIIFSIQFNF